MRIATRDLGAVNFSSIADLVAISRDGENILLASIKSGVKLSSHGLSAQNSPELSGAKR